MSTAFVQLRGNFEAREDVLDWLRKLANQYSSVVVCVGVGESVVEGMTDAGYFPVISDQRLGERPKTGLYTDLTMPLAGRVLFEKLLLAYRQEVEDHFRASSVLVKVVASCRPLGDVVVSPVDVTLTILTVYHGFEQLFFLCREGNKREFELKYESNRKIQVVGFGESSSCGCH